MSIVIMYAIFNVHLLVNTCFIQRTEQVLIELDISAIEEYVIIIIIDTYLINTVLILMIGFITQFVDCPQYAYIVRNLSYFRDYVDQFVLTSTEIVQLIEYLCTINISKLISPGDIISYLYYIHVYYCVPSCAEMTCVIALLCMII